jgi:hypothetical protein
MNSIGRQFIKLTMLPVFLTLSACASQDTRFGDSVRHVQDAQIYNKSAALAPESAPVPQDGQKAQIVIDTFWEVGRERKQIHNAIDINVGN